MFCYLMTAVSFVNPQRVDESISCTIQRLVFGAVRNKHLYATMMLLVGDEYSD